MCRGRVEMSAPPREKLAFQAKAVQTLISLSDKQGDFEQSAMYAVGRMCLLRMPSECIPLYVDAEHSSVAFGDQEVVITLTRWKPSRKPCVIRRQCC